MKHEIQAACIQAAATLLVAKNVVSGAKSVDVGACMRLTEELYENATGERYERASSSGGGAQNLPGRPLDARSPPYTPEGERAIRRPRPGRHPQYGGSTIARGIDRPTGDGLRAQRRGIRSGGQ